MFKRICGFSRVNFTAYRPENDRAFFDLYTGMVGKPVAECIAEVKERFQKNIWKRSLEPNVVKPPPQAFECAAQ